MAVENQREPKGIESFTEKLKLVIFPALMGILVWFASQMFGDLHAIQDSQTEQMKELIRNNETMKMLQWRIERLESKLYEND